MNGTHTLYSDVPVPEDAHDKGTLTPLFAAPSQPQFSVGVVDSNGDIYPESPPPGTVLYTRPQAGREGVHHDDWYALCNAYSRLQSACKNMVPLINSAFLATPGSGERYDALKEFADAVRVDPFSAQGGSHG